MISKPYIKLKNVSKVFGQNPDTVIELVKNNIDKTELQNDHNHVIGLQNINIDTVSYTHLTLPTNREV